MLRRCTLNASARDRQETRAMIDRIEFLEEPLEAGESRDLLVWGRDPLEVEIECFVEKPPPPGFRGCPECGSFPLTSGEALAITASPTVFADGTGTLMITIRDADNDKRLIRLHVISPEANRGSMSA